MRICRWCGRRLRWWEFLFSYCNVGCRTATSLNLPSPPCRYMEHLPGPGE